MIKTINIWVIFCLLSLPVVGQDDDMLKKQYEFINTIKGSFEGYRYSDCKNTISYHSLRHDVREGMITRSTDGLMGIDWDTEALPDNFQSDGAWFIWLAAVEAHKRVNFDVFVDGVQRFTFHSGPDNSFTLNHQEGGILQFRPFNTDQNGDSHGYMTMYAPISWLQPGKPLHIKILGEAAGENSWVIVYKAGDIVDHLIKSTEYQVWLDVTIRKSQGQHEVVVTGPASLAGDELFYQSGRQQGSIVLVEGKAVATARFSLEGDIQNQEFIISDENSELLYLDNLKKDTVLRKLLPKAVIINELTLSGGQIKAESRRLYKPKTAKRILALNESKLGQGRIFLMNSSHQDLAWMDSPGKCVIERDTMLITPLIEQAQADPGYRFDIEDASMIKEYIERHPDKKESIRQLFKEGKISCGSSYTQPYEEMYSGEALVRQFYTGRKWLKDEFDYDANTYWNVDVPGRTWQMPQILKKSGVPNMVISRQEKGIFNWFGPDGSFVTAYSPGHYGEAYTSLHENFYEAAEYIAKSSMMWEKYYAKESPETVVPLLSDWDMSPANDYSHMIRQWESNSELTDENGVKTSIALPRFKIVTIPELFESFVVASNPLPSIKGERPALWLYIHGPSHQKALKASREGDILLTMAEKFATINALATKSFAAYPAARLDEAWEAKIFPDHGWGGKNGQITDDLFRRKYEFARSEASQILENSTRSIASHVKASLKKGIPVVVFNSLNWERTDMVYFQIGFSEGDAMSISMIDASGNDIPVQYQVEKRYMDGSIQLAEVYFVAGKVPSIGYKTFYVKNLQENIRTGSLPSMESSFYKIELGRGGLISIFDKALQTELIDATKFAAGEVFTMQSIGNGAGEFDRIQQPSMEGFAQVGDYPAKWEPGESGDVFSAWTRRSELPHAVVEQKIILHHMLKRIDFEISLLNWEGVLYREFRMALPLKMDNGQVAYEVPFGVVEVGKDEMEGAAGERYQVPAKELHPRGIENWIGASDDSFGVTLSSSVAVADYLDPTDDPVSTVILQPLLLASRRSCHSEGNEYLQTGNHYFSFSLNSHLPGWFNGYKTGRQANEKLYTVVNPEPYANAHLPEEKSFFFLDEEGIIISTIKKAEDDPSVIVRMFEVKGENRNIKLHHDFTFHNAVSTNLIEQEINEIPLRKNQTNIRMAQNAIETVKLK